LLISSHRPGIIPTLSPTGRGTRVRGVDTSLRRLSGPTSLVRVLAPPVRRSVRAPAAAVKIPFPVPSRRGLEHAARDKRRRAGGVRVEVRVFEARLDARVREGRALSGGLGVCRHGVMVMSWVGVLCREGLGGASDWVGRWIRWTRCRCTRCTRWTRCSKRPINGLFFPSVDSSPGGLRVHNGCCSRSGNSASQSQGRLSTVKPCRPAASPPKATIVRYRQASTPKQLSRKFNDAASADPQRGHDASIPARLHCCRQT
jgi:hypothetical protein